MKGLVWKELREWGPLTASLLLALSAVWCLAAQGNDLLIVPSQEPTLAVLATASVAGLLLGYAQFGVEGARGTLSFLAHRKGGLRALLRGKIAVGIPLALAVGMLPPLVSLAWNWFGEFGPALQPERALEHGLAGLVAVPAYACGLLIAKIAPSSFLKFALGLLACAGCCLYSLWLPLPALAMSHWTAPIFALGEIVLGAALLAIAARVFERSHDRDVVLSRGLQSALALFALLFVVYPAWFAFDNSVRTASMHLFNGYPLIVRSADGKYSTISHAEYDERVRTGDMPRRTVTLPDGAQASEAELLIVYNPFPPFEWERSLRFSPLRVRSTLADPRRWIELTRLDGMDKSRTYFDFESGRACRFEGAQTPILASRPDGKPFSRSTVVFNELPVTLFVDREDRTTWTLERRDGRLEFSAIALPEGQRLLDVQPEYPKESDGWLLADWERPVLVGERGRYQWTADGLRPAASPAARPAWIRYCRGEIGESTLASMTVRLRDVERGEIVHEQRYEPRTPGEQARVACMRMGLLCGPPVLSAQRLIAGSSAPLFAEVLPSPATLPKDTTWFHLVHAFLGLLLGVLAWRHVARRGGSLQERVLWSAFAGLFGVFALCFLLMLAPRPLLATATRAERSVAKPSPQPLAAT